MNETLQRLMSKASQLTQAGRLKDATAAIQRALRDAADAAAHRNASVATGEGHPKVPIEVLEGCVFEVDARKPAATPSSNGDAGAFTEGRHSHASLTRNYKLYAPPGQFGRRLPLVVMLHGCTQDPDDFAAGTGMNARAREQGFFVLYPAQAQDANPSRCWNWFKHSHQQRGRGEPAVIAAMTQAVIDEHDIDPRRVYIAGLSAGGAMAAIVAAAYPEIFAAVGVHSGLAPGAAGSLPEALAAMKGVAAGTLEPSLLRVPTIVFHGDQDQTVHPRNGEQVIAAVLGSAAADATQARMEHAASVDGRRYTRSRHAGNASHPPSEHWLVHGAGHAWSGGLREGSYTDEKGPDATREMLRFFFEQRGALGH